MSDPIDPLQERLELALEAAGMDLWETDLVTGEMTKAVTKTLAELGYDASDYGTDINDTLRTLTHPDDFALIYAAIDRHVSGATPQYRCEFRLRAKTGAWVWFANYGKMMQTGGPQPGRRFIGVTFNINDRKRSEDEHARLNLQLQEQLAEREAREQALSAANLRAEAANLAKSLFLANMSHEIRTPMNAIIGLSHLALRTGLSTQQRDYLDKIHHAGTALLGIVNDILDLSKIEAGKLGLEHTGFLLGRALDNVTSLLAHKAEEKQLALRIDVAADVPRTLVGDPLRLEQILSNLVGNALKFTDQGGVTLSASLLERRGNAVQLQFAVRDSGIGMTLDQQQRLFKAFSQGDDSVTRKYGGTGLGLTITRQLVELMGGAIWVDSAPGLGSTFTCTLWLRLADNADEAAADSAPDDRPGNQSGDTDAEQRLHGLRVLLVEDNDINQQVARELLQDAGVHVSSAGNGAIAVGMIETGPAFDLVLMDLQMPVMDGYATTAAIRANPARAALPIIAMTAHTMVEDRTRCLSAGMNDHISKPIDPPRLFDALARWSGRAGPAAVVAPLAGAGGVDTAPLAPPALLAMEGTVQRLRLQWPTYTGLLNKFVSEYGDVAARIEQACAAGQRDAARRLVHTIKGTAATLGADLLSQHAAALELALRDEDNATAALHRFCAVCASTMQAIAKVARAPDARPLP
jgi:signal transduction histidine kinase/CheY-like chemotaxis protein/HPt (histidine-containing phosphotransfer) domain-containing protein